MPQPRWARPPPDGSNTPPARLRLRLRHPALNAAFCHFRRHRRQQLLKGQLVRWVARRSGAACGLLRLLRCRRLLHLLHRSQQHHVGKMVAAPCTALQGSYHAAHVAAAFVPPHRRRQPPAVRRALVSSHGAALAVRLAARQSRRHCRFTADGLCLGSGSCH